MLILNIFSLNFFVLIHVYIFFYVFVLMSSLLTWTFSYDYIMKLLNLRIDKNCYICLEFFGCFAGVGLGSLRLLFSHNTHGKLVPSF